MDVKWLINRFRAMSPPEVLWRVQQKITRQRERRTLYALHLPVTKLPLSVSPRTLRPYPETFSCRADSAAEQFQRLALFGRFDYSTYRTKWNAGFQTDAAWPAEDFSASIPVSQREDIGDIRTNWELNRHLQFAGLARNYALTGDAASLRELSELFDDWNRNNLFLHGVQWTSAMEIAIRAINWVAAYCFLTQGFQRFGTAVESQSLLDGLSHGVLVMADYVRRHRAKFSSANNHLIVEMSAVGMAGVFFQKEAWIQDSLRTLTRELPRQNFPDGINREMSLHYQAFVMEAYGLLWLALKSRDREPPVLWTQYLSAMSEYLADCCGAYGETVVFGDDDGGEILNLTGARRDYYRYVLQLMGALLPSRYTDAPFDSTMETLLDDAQKDAYREKKLYQPPDASVRKEGGYTILRSRDRKLLIAFDHAALGFDAIAAHGHADALSVQLYYEGHPILTDAGTYNYHVPKEARNRFQRTEAHNTVYAGTEQAEALGPFLWGKRYAVTLKTAEVTEHQVRVCVEIAYGNVRHQREITFDYQHTLLVRDTVSGASDARQIWHFAPGLAIRQENSCVRIGPLRMKCETSMAIAETYQHSSGYNWTAAAQCLSFPVFRGSAVTTIRIDKEGGN